MTELKLNIGSKEKSAIAQKLDSFKVVNPKAEDSKKTKPKSQAVEAVTNDTSDIKGQQSGQETAVNTIDSKADNTQQNTNLPKKKKPLINKEKYKEILEYLSNKYPKCFKEEPEPLKIKIHRDLWENNLDKLSKIQIKIFLAIYCKKNKYRKSMIVGANRIDLNGEVTSVITEQEIEYMNRMKKSAKKHEQNDESAKITEQTVNNDASNTADDDKNSVKD